VLDGLVEMKLLTAVKDINSGISYRFTDAGRAEAERRKG
jgi:hypothetical protein